MPHLEDATCFDDIPELEAPAWMGEVVPCPRCLKHGGWVLELNAYPQLEPPDRHFRCSCIQCNGWGWVREGSDDESCLHDFKWSQGERMFEKVVTCRKCGHTRTYDSSG